MLWWPKLHPSCLSVLEIKILSHAGLVRALKKVVESNIWNGTWRRQASHHTTWYISFPMCFLGSWKGSVALGQAIVSFHNQEQHSGASGFRRILLLARFTYCSHCDNKKNIFLQCSSCHLCYLSMCERDAKVLRIMDCSWETGNMSAYLGYTSRSMHLSLFICNNNEIASLEL